MKVLKWIGIILGSILVILGLAAFGMSMRGKSRMDKTWQVAGLLTSYPTDSLSIIRGEHLVATHGCRTCHGAHLEGTLFLDIPLFRIVAPNLTKGKGGIGGSYVDQDWDRSIRHGVRPNGKSMLVMPYPLFHNLADDDFSALVSYLKTLPAVDSVLEPSKTKWLGYAMIGMAGEAEVAPALTPSPHQSPLAVPTVEYGQYLASHSCVVCHGQDLRGGKPADPESPPAPPLMAAGFWSLAQFTAALRTGKLPDGRILSDFMPWKGAFTNLSDVEILALHTYIKSLPRN